MLRKENAPFETASWSARLPETEQDSLAANLLSKNCDRYFITFDGDTDLPEGITNPGPGIVHMASFNYAHKLNPVTEWLLQQHK